MSESHVVNILINTLSKTTGSKDAKASLKMLGNEFKNVTGMSLGYAGAMTTAIAVGKKMIDFTKQAVQETEAYVSSIVDLARVVGMTTEEMSKLVQAGDDVFISQENMTKALKAAVKQGIDVSIEGIKNLSREYLALDPKVDRGQWLFQRFGKSGADMGKLLEKGADGITKAMAAVEQSLVVTGKSVQQIESYKKSVDSLSDSWMAFKMKIGMYIVPSLDVLFRALQDGEDPVVQNARKIQQLQQELSALTKYAGQSGMSQHDLGIKVRELQYQIAFLNGSFKLTGDELEQIIDAEEAAAIATEALNRSVAATDFQTKFTDAKDGSERFALSLGMIRSGLQEMGAVGEDTYQAILLGLGEITPAAVRAMIDTKRVISEIESMLAKGFSTDVIVNFVMQYQTRGTVPATPYLGGYTVDNANAFIAQTQLMAGYVPNTTITKANSTSSSSSGSTSSTTNYTANDVANAAATGVSVEAYVASQKAAGLRDSGGPGSAGQAYIITPKASPEVFIPKTDGQFYPNANLGGDTTININVYGVSDPRAVADEVMRRFSLQKVGRS